MFSPNLEEIERAPMNVPTAHPQGIADADARRRVLVLAVAVALLTAVAAWRAWVLARPGTPPGIDTGNWLAFGDALIGRSVKPEGVAYPPTIPLLLVAAVRAFGATAGVALVGGLSAIMPAIAAWFALSRAKLGGWALFLVAAVAVLPAVGDITAWGGYPQLFAAPFVVATLWFLDRWIRVGEVRACVGSAVAFGVILATSHFAALGVSVSIIVLLVARLASGDVAAMTMLRRAGLAAGGFVVAAAPVVVVYARLIPAVFATQAAGGTSSAVAFDALPSEFARVHGVATPIVAVGVLAAIGAVAVARDRRDTLWGVTVALAIGTLATLLGTREPRVLYDAPVVAALGTGVWAKTFLERRSDLPKRALAGALAVLILVLAVSAWVEFPRQRKRFAVLSSDTVSALDWLRERTPADSLVVVTSVEGMPLGWWTEGLADRRTLGEISPRWLVFPEERVVAARARTVIRAFDAGLDHGLRAAREAGADYLVVSGTDPLSSVLHLYQDAGQLRPVYANDAILIVDVAHPAGRRV